MPKPTEENLKKAYQDAKKDLEDKKQVELKTKIQAIIKATLEKIELTERSIEDKRQAIKNDQKTISILRADLKDLEAGRLDLIEERQKNDIKAKDVSVALISRVINDTFNNQPWKNVFELFSEQVGSITASGTTFTNYVPGTYTLSSGSTINISPFYY